MTDNPKLNELHTLLQKEKADYAIHLHEFTLKSAAEGAKHFGISMSQTTPTLILQSHGQYFAAIICGDMRISFKKLKKALNVDEIMADPQTIFRITGANIGEICLINAGMITLIDQHVLHNVDCYGGCGVPKATLRINTQDLIRITKAQVLDFAETR